MIAFLHIPKTAGSRLNHILRSSLGIHHCDSFFPRSPEHVFGPADLAFAQRVFIDLRCIGGHFVTDPVRNLPPAVRCFVFLREPIARCASAFQHAVQRWDQPTRKRRRPMPTFESWIERPENWDAQTTQIAGVPDLEAAKQVVADRFFFVGLTENFESGARLLARLSPHPLDTAVRPLRGRPAEYVDNVAQDSRIKDALLADPRRRAELEAINRVDTALYRHVQEVLYPAQMKQAAGGSAERSASPARARLRYRASKLYNNVVYRTALKLAYRIGRPTA